jgi:hypothetical protein
LSGHRLHKIAIPRQVFLAMKNTGSAINITNQNFMMHLYRLKVTMSFISNCSFPTDKPFPQEKTGEQIKITGNHEDETNENRQPGINCKAANNNQE